MNCKVGRSELSGTISCPHNKSYTHRAVFLASMAGNGSKVQNALISGDTMSSIQACRALGARLDVSGDMVSIHEGISHAGSIDAANSGTTIRIAAAIAALFPGTTTLDGDDSLRKRPMGPLCDALRTAGARCDTNDGRPPLTVSGVMNGGQINVSGNVSSQFVSALAMAAPHTHQGMDIRIDGNLVSKPYLDITMATMRRFGVAVQTIIPYSRYVVPSGTYRPAEFLVPLDFSTLALILSAAVLCGDDLVVYGCMDELPQGDDAFLDILHMMGVRLDTDGSAMRVVSPRMLRGGTFDLGNSPDLLPPLAILASKASGEVRITGVGHARHKETDRISVLSTQLVKAGLRVAEYSDGLSIYRGRPRPACLDSCGDHRLFMALCILGMYIGGCTVSGAESAAVSYPDFIRDMKGAGADITIC